VLGYLPELLVRFAPWAVFAAANGQLVAFQRETYAATGGHAVVRAHVVEDVALARATKRAGRRLVMADGNGLIGCRMYTGWPSVRDGYAKNIIAGHGGLVPLVLSTLFHWAVFIAPWLWLALGWTVDLGPGYSGWPLALIGLGTGVRTLTAAATRQRIADAALMPVSALLMTRITVRAVAWRFRAGGPQWKGRALSPAGARREVKGGER
jgi:chlorobactene glucosyltransferase